MRHAGRVVAEPVRSPDRLPTLTEVVMEGPQFPAPGATPRLAPAADSPSVAATDAGAIVDAVMGSLQARIDLMLEYRLREALTPLLARAAETMVQETRAELAQTLRDVVARAVAQELARRRLR